jgi:hypothetical protein
VGDTVRLLPSASSGKHGNKAWLVGQRAVLRAPRPEGGWLVRVEGRGGAVDEHVPARALALEQRRAFTSGDGVVAAAAWEAGEAGSRAIEGGVVRLGQATGEGEWLAARADGAAVDGQEELVFVREAELRRLPAPQAREQRAAAAEHSPAELQAEALVVAAQVLETCCVFTMVRCFAN